MATRHYLKVEGRMQIAALSRDDRTVAELAPLVQRAAEERTDLRREIESHENASRTGAATA